MYYLTSYYVYFNLPSPKINYEVLMVFIRLKLKSNSSKRGHRIMDIFKQLDAILAIKRPQYAKMVDQWRGRKPFKYAKDESTKDDFVSKYVKDHSDPFDEEAFKQELIDDIRDLKSKYEEFYESIKDEYSACVHKIAAKGLKDELDDALRHSNRKVMALANFILNNDLIEITDYYKQALENSKDSYEEDQYFNLAGDAAAQYGMVVDELEGEEITVNVSKVYEDLFNRLKGQNKLNTKYRLYFKVLISSSDISKSNDVNLINRGRYNYKVLYNALLDIIREYFDILGKKESRAKALEIYYREEGTFIANILDGYYHDPITDRKIRIGKMIEFVKAKKPDFECTGGITLSRVEKVYTDRPRGFTGMVCISRHPHDIASMSTDRGWHSCMDLNKPTEFTRYVPLTILGAGLIAYLIKEDDIKVQNPSSRLLLKSYVREGEEIDYENPNWLLGVSYTYGVDYPSVTKFVQDWADENWNKYIQRNKKEKYKLNPECYAEKTDKKYYSMDK